MAILQGCTWVLQIDSDGQCDPQYFPQFWEAREKGICVQGVRTTREDGFIRLIASRLFSLVTYFISGVYIRDSNVPYRLMDSNVLSLVIQSVPEDFDLANIVVSYLFSTKFHIKWVPINFRERASGQSKRNTRKSIQVTLRYISQLQALLKGPTGLVANTCARLNGR